MRHRNDNDSFVNSQNKRILKLLLLIALSIGAVLLGVGAAVNEPRMVHNYSVTSEQVDPADMSVPITDFEDLSNSEQIMVKQSYGSGQPVSVSLDGPATTESGWITANISGSTVHVGVTSQGSELAQYELLELGVVAIGLIALFPLFVWSMELIDELQSKWDR